MNCQNAVPALAGAICVAAMSMYLFNPPLAEAQSPPQGPPPATPNARTIPFTAINDVLMNLINLELATKNAALANDPNFHAVLTAAPDAAGPELSQTNNTDSPNQFIALAPYTMFYWVRDISVRVGNWVPVADSGIIAQRGIRFQSHLWD